MCIWSDRLSQLETLNQLNPNKYTAQQQKDLYNIRQEIKKGLLVIRRTKQQLMKGVFTFTTDRKHKLDLWQKFTRQLDYIEEDLSLSHLLKPVNGLVIHHCRVKKTIKV